MNEMDKHEETPKRNAQFRFAVSLLGILAVLSLVGLLATRRDGSDYVAIYVGVGFAFIFIALAVMDWLSQ